MEGLMSSKAWMGAPLTWRNRCSVVLALAVLVAMITADAPVAPDGPSLRPAMLDDAGEGAPRRTPSTPPAEAPPTETSGRPDPAPATAAPPSPRNPASPANRGRRIPAATAGPLDSPPPTPDHGTSPSSKGPLVGPPLPLGPPPRAGQGGGPARRPREAEPATPGSTNSTLSPSPVSNHPLLPQNSSASSTRSLFTSAGTSLSPQLPVSDHQRAPDEPPLPATPHPGNQSESTPTITTSRPVRPLDVPGSPANDSDPDPDPAPSQSPGRVSPDPTRLSPSRDPSMGQDSAQAIHLLLSPSSVPLLSPYASSSSSSSSSSAEPTLAPPEDFFPTDTMDVDWGSGDYLETLSFLGSEGDDYAPVTSLPSDMFELDESDAESYDTSFPSRAGVAPSSRHHHVLTSPPPLATAAAYIPGVGSTHPPSLRPSVTPSSLPPPSLPGHPVALERTPPPPGSAQSSDGGGDWSDAFAAVEPTDALLLLPDMNSREFYATAETAAHVPVGSTRVMAAGVFSTDAGRLLTASYGYGGGGGEDNATWVEEEASSDFSGEEPFNATAAEPSEAAGTPQLVMNVSEVFPEPSVAATPSAAPSSGLWDGQASSWGDWSGPVTLTPTPTEGLESEGPESVEVDAASSSLTDVLWFVSSSSEYETTPLGSSPSAAAVPVPTPSLAFTPLPTDVFHNISWVTAEPSHSATSAPPATGVMADQGATTDAVTSDDIVTAVTKDGWTTISTNTSPVPTTEATTTTNTTSTTTTTATTTSSTTTSTTTTTAASTMNTEASTSPSLTTPTSATTVPVATPPRHYMCNVTNPAYLVRVGFPPGVTVGYAKSQMRDILKSQFNRSLELQVVEPPPRLVFRAVSGPVVYTAISVVNALGQSGRRFLSVAPNWTAPDHQYRVHSVLQFVPSHMDVRVCNFSERVEKGLTMAYAEARRRSKESTNFTVQIVNITAGQQQQPRSPPRQQREQVDITFAVRDAHGPLRGSEVSGSLRKLNMVEFSYYLGFPVLQIAEPFHYPELNTTQLLRSSWVRTVLLGVLEQGVEGRRFQARMERGLALLLGEALGAARRARRATSAGNNSVQMVSASRLEGPDQPLEMVYFVEGPSAERLPAVATATLLNGLDVQRAAIVLGYRVQGVLAQPVEKVSAPPPDNENTNLWIVVGVVVPLVVVVVIISILYWKLCRTDKLEFQPDAMTSVQQRQKLQAPSVKGFDFAKLHLGQHSKDDVLVIQEPAPLPLPLPSTTEVATPENGNARRSPRSKNSTSSAKAGRSARRRGRISPSDGDSAVSDRSSERESAEESARGVAVRGVATPGDSKLARKVPINVLNGPPPQSGPPDQQLSSASIFEHVDRMSRPADANRRLTNKIQLIAMQPMPVPPFLHPMANGRVPDSNSMNMEQIQVALRHKSEIEHHRNKIRLRAKRKGHYDFPVMEGLADGPDQDRDQDRDRDRLYHKAQQQIDKILDPDIHMPSLFTEPKKSGRGRRSPRQRRKQQPNGVLTEADKDRLISNDSDGTYRKYPGVSNVAYVSDPAQAELRSPSPLDDVFLGPSSPPPGHAPPPPPYMPPQPSIEEARQQMHSLLDDAFALVSPTSQGSTAGITLPGVGGHSDPPGSSPPARGPRPWPPSYPALSPFSGRYAELGISPPSVLLQRQGLGLGGGADVTDSLYPSRGLYPDDLPSSARPRPVGGSTGVQLHHLAPAGLPGRLNGYAGGGGVGGRPPPGHNGGGGTGWSPYTDDDLLPRPTPSSRDATPRSGPSAPPAHLDPAPGLGYGPASSALAQEQAPPPNHSSASLIKAIREELLRLSQKQAAVSSYHS